MSSSSSVDSVLLLTGNTLMSMEDRRKMTFVKLPSIDADAEKYEFQLGFEGRFFGVHPPTNVLAVLEEPKLAEKYVTSEWFLIYGNMTLKSSTHLQEHQDSHSENGHGRSASLCYKKETCLGNPA